LIERRDLRRETRAVDGLRTGRLMCAHHGHKRDPNDGAAALAQ